MGHSKDDKAASHERIVEVAAARMREAGTEAPGVAEIMSAAGLTHGGFYKHFGSRDDLVAEAVDRALADGERALERLTEGAPDPLAAFVDWYTSADHRDHPGAGCAIVALGADAARGDDRVRRAYAAQVQRYLGHLQELLGGDGEEGRRAAVTALSALVGAVLVARAVEDEALSQEILSDVRELVTSRTPAP